MSDKLSSRHNASGIHTQRDLRVSGEGHDIAGRDVIKTSIEQLLISGRVGTRWPYQREMMWLVDGATKAVVGREPIIERIIDRLAQPAPGYVLIQAPAGYGKTTLVAEIIRRIRGGNWPSARPALVYYFIREEEQQHTPEMFLLAVISQLLDILRPSDVVELDPTAQRLQFSRIWTEAVDSAQEDRPLLLMLDGLDEMASETSWSIASLLPGLLGRNVYVLATSRPNPAPLAQVPPEHPLRDALLLGLDTFTREHIAELIASMGQGAVTELATPLAERVWALTRGEPLFACFVCEDVAREGERALLALENNPPQGVQAYFAWQLDRLHGRATREGDLAWSLLQILAAARGSMTMQELADVADAPVHQVDSSLRPLRRFFQEGPRVSLMHHELRTAILDELSPKQHRHATGLLLHWCREYELLGWPDNTPEYVIEHYAGHLYGVKDWKHLHSLPSERWMRIKMERSGSHWSFASDVLLSIRAAGEQVPPDLEQELRGSLIIATLGSMAAGLRVKMLGVLAQTHQIELAEAHMRLIGDLRQRFEAQLELIHGLVASHHLERAAHHAEEAMSDALSLPDSLYTSEMLADFASSLVDVGRPELAIHIAERILVTTGFLFNENRKARVLSSLARLLAQTNDVELTLRIVEQVITTAQAIRIKSREKARPLIDVVAVLDGLGHRVQAARVAEMALDALPQGRTRREAMDEAVATIVRNVSSELALQVIDLLEDHYKATAFAELALDFASTGRTAQALHAAEQALQLSQAYRSERFWFGVRNFAAVSRALAYSGQTEQALWAAQQALSRVKATHNSSQKAQDLVLVGHAFTVAGQVGRMEELAQKALDLLRGSPVQRPTVVASMNIADELRRAGRADLALDALEEGLRVILALPNKKRLGSVAAKVVSGLADLGRSEQALSALQTLSDTVQEGALVGAAGALVKAGYGPEVSQMAEQILQADQAPPSIIGRPSAYATIADELDRTGEPELAKEIVMQALRDVKSLPETRYRKRLSMNVAASLNKIVGIDIAMEAIDISGPGGRNRIKGLVLNSARSGYLEAALNAVRLLQGEVAKVTPLSDVAWRLLDSGDVDRAGDIARRVMPAALDLPNNEDKVRALVVVAGLLGRTGQTQSGVRVAQQALRVADHFVSTSDRPKALTQVAGSI